MRIMESYGRWWYFSHNSPIQNPQPLSGQVFPDSYVASRDKSNCMVSSIGHHTYVSSPSITQRALCSTTLWPSIISHVWNYRGFIEQLSPSYLIMSSMACLLFTNKVRCAPPLSSLSITAWQVSQRTASEWGWARKPRVHRCNWLLTWQIVCFICKRGRKRGPTWDLSALHQARTACGYGAGHPGPWKGPCWGVNQSTVNWEKLKTSALYLLPSPEQGS